MSGKEGVAEPSRTLKGFADQTCKIKVRNETRVELPGTFEGFVAFQREEHQGVFSDWVFSRKLGSKGFRGTYPPER